MLRRSLLPQAPLQARARSFGCFAWSISGLEAVKRTFCPPLLPPTMQSPSPIPLLTAKAKEPPELLHGFIPARLIGDLGAARGTLEKKPLRILFCCIQSSKREHRVAYGFYSLGLLGALGHAR